MPLNNKLNAPELDKGKSDYTSVIHFPIDEPTSANMESSPLISKLLEVDEFKETYHKYLKEIADNYFTSGIYSTKLKEKSELIDEYVKNDSTAFYSSNEFKNSLESLNTFGTLRAKSILLQLSGEIPSTKQDQSNVDLNSYFGDNAINMSVLGGMGGEMDKGNNPPNKEPLAFDFPTPKANDDFKEDFSPDNIKPQKNRENPPDFNNKSPNNKKDALNSNSFLSMNKSELLYVFISFISLILSLIFTLKFKRKK